MSKTGFKLVLLIFCSYVGYTQYLIREYNKFNDKLNAVNDTLLSACTASKIEDVEKVSYK